MYFAYIDCLNNKSPKQRGNWVARFKRHPPTPIHSWNLISLLRGREKEKEERKNEDPGILTEA